MTDSQSTAASRLAALEAAAAAGDIVSAEDYAQARAAADAEQRLIQIAAAGQRRRDEDASARAARQAQEDAKTAAAALLTPSSAALRRAYTVAVAALRDLTDQADTYGEAFTDAIRTLSRGRVPVMVIPEAEPGQNDPVDPANHAQFAPSRYDRAEAVVADGVTHLLPTEPAAWLLAALSEASTDADGRSLVVPGGRTIHSVIGQRQRPYLP